MTKSIGIKVNPELLRWARESLGVATDQTAKRLGVADELVQEWENGKKLITYRRLETLAGYYRRPLAAFFLPKSPEEEPLSPDLRTPAKRKLVISPDIKLAFRRARFLRNAFAAISPDDKKLASPEISLLDNAEKIATTERERLGIAFDVQRRWAPGQESFSNWVQLLEENNILVFQKGFPTEELSGFSIPDKKKPSVIVINSRDVAPRKIFTLFHEYCHLLLNSGGICKLRIRSKEIESDNSIETFCDKFAAAFLVPADIIFSRPEIEQIQQQIKDEDAIRSLANLFKVSRQVIILRLLLAKKITREYYDAKKRKFDIEFTIFLKKKREREKKSKGGPLPHILSVSEHGKLFSRTVVSAFREGKISSKDASTYLGVKLNYIPHIESIL